MAGLPKSWTRLDGVDLLRGLAILLVPLNHINMRLFGAKISYLENLPAQLATSIAWNGQSGVQIPNPVWREYSYLGRMDAIALGCLTAIVLARKPLARAVPVLFLVVILIAGLLGELVARGYSEPMNRWLRRRFGDGPKQLGSILTEKTASA